MIFASRRGINSTAFQPALLLGGLVAIAASGLGAAEPNGSHRVEVSRVLVTPIHETEIPARETGVLAEVNVQVGEMVEPGRLLARIDDTEAKMTEGLAEVELAIADKKAQAEPLVEAAEAAYAVAQRNLQRAEESLATFGRSISQAEIDDYRLKATEAKTLVWERRRELEIAAMTSRFHEQQVDLARARTKRHRIVSPIGGMVKQIDREPGEWVTPGQPVARILRLDRLRCVGFVAADLVRDDAVRNQLVGRNATLHVPAPTPQQARAFVGQVTFVDPEIEPESDQVKIWVEIENQDLKLRPGDRGTLMIDWPQAVVPGPVGPGPVGPGPVGPGPVGPAPASTGPGGPGPGR